MASGDQAKITAMQIAIYTEDGWEGSCVQCPNCTDLAGQDVELPSGSVVTFEWARRATYDCCDSCGACLDDVVEETACWREPTLGEKWEQVIS